MGAVQTTYTVAPPAAYAGMLADDTENDIMTMVNAESSLSMPFGIVVAFSSSSPLADTDAKLPSASLTRLAGIVVHEHDVERSFSLPDGSTAGELDSTGYKVGAAMSVLWRGTIWVKVQQAVVPGDRLFVCKTANAVYTAAGQIGNADESTNTIDASAIGRFISTAAAGGFAKLQVDFSQKP